MVTTVEEILAVTGEQRLALVGLPTSLLKAVRELHAEWHGPTDRYALDHLHGRGFIFADDHWRVPASATLKDLRAILFVHIRSDYPLKAKPLLQA
jgi:hypothetical protein